MPSVTNERPIRRPLPRWVQAASARLTDDRCAGDGGYVMVLLALTFTLLLAFAGYSVDAGNWNLHRNEVRTATEAAALGGVSFLPDDLASAQATAIQIARHHGYDDADADTTVTVGLGSGDNQLEVVISHDVSNYFLRAIGMTSTTISSSAVAEFDEPVDMGSPEHILGNDPETGFEPGYWLSIASAGVPKENGDRFNPASCAAAGTGGCTGPANNENDPSGYKYAVRVSDTTVPLRIQIFDPAWVWTGSLCNIPNWPTAAEIATLQAIDDGSNPSIPFDYYADAATRYAGSDDEWCVGDDRPGSIGPATSFQVRLPDTSPWDDNDNPVVGAGTCQPVTFPAYQPTSPYAAPSASIFELLNPTAPGGTEWEVRNDGIFTFAEVFRRWVTICEIPVGPWLIEGDYIVQVQAPGSTGGQNRFSLRAGPPSGANSVVDVGQATFARGRFPIYANTRSVDTRFHVVRVPPSSGERILELTFFDIGDATAPGILTVEPPPGAQIADRFQQCAFTVGGIPVTSANCRLTGVHDSAGFGEQVTEGVVTIPSQNDPINPYWCDVSDPDDCWVTVRLQFPPPGLTDATTWTANLVGDAVRIIDDD